MWYKNELSLTDYRLNETIMTDEAASNIPESIKCVIVGDGAVGNRSFSTELSSMNNII